MREDGPPTLVGGFFFRSGKNTNVPSGLTGAALRSHSTGALLSVGLGKGLNSFHALAGCFALPLVFGSRAALTSMR